MAGPDLSNIPSEDLQHIAAGDMGKVSTPTLKYLSGKPLGGPVAMPDATGLAGPLGQLVEGASTPADLLASGVSHVASSVLNPVARLVARGVAAVQGKDTDQAAENASKFINTQGTYHARTPGGQDVENAAAAVPAAVGTATAPVESALQSGAHQIEQATGLPQGSLNTAAGTATDVLGSVPVGGAVADIARGAAVRAPATSTAEALGLRSAEDSPVGRTLAGPSAKPALTAHNAQVGDAVLSNEAGIANGTKPSYDALSSARQPANDVYDRVVSSLPEHNQLDPTAVGEVNKAGLPEGGRMSAGSPQAQQQIEDLRARLTDPHADFSAQQMVNELKGLRQEGYTNIGSDDVSNQQLGAAQLDMARAIEGHIGRNLPADGTVNLAQFQDARKALAKNWTAQSTLRGDTFDLKALARIQRADPDLLDGNMKTLADFANANPEVVGAANPLNTPGVMHDLGNVSFTKPGTWVPPVTGALGRRMLTGGPGVLDRTNNFFSARPPQQFPPLEPQGPQPPPGMTAGPMGAPPSPTGPQGGGYSLADLLSHGVEQAPEPGLTAGPMGAPAPQGVPFRAPPEAFGADQLSLADHLAGPAPAANGDHAAVMSQGVPEGIAQRTAAPARLSLADLLSPDGLHPAPRTFTVNRKGKATEK